MFRLRFDPTFWLWSGLALVAAFFLGLSYGQSRQSPHTAQPPPVHEAASEANPTPPVAQGGQAPGPRVDYLGNANSHIGEETKGGTPSEFDHDAMPFPDLSPPPSLQAPLPSIAIPEPLAIAPLEIIIQRGARRLILAQGGKTLSEHLVRLTGRITASGNSVFVCLKDVETKRFRGFSVGSVEEAMAILEETEANLEEAEAGIRRDFGESLRDRAGQARGRGPADGSSEMVGIQSSRHNRDTEVSQAFCVAPESLDEIWGLCATGAVLKLEP